MKNLNLNAYGVSEMSEAQMREVEGGSWWKILIEVATVVVSVVKAVADLLKKPEPSPSKTTCCC
ncbi:hypothetical protein AGMMS49965_08510 [Bacteroidia bacterium]|nr:hypothetical protein AGMMS49965_08510 [Bacteroidia bacterium]